MKKWSGGMLIVALATILVVRYSLVGNKVIKRQKQSAYDFFRNHHPSDKSRVKDNGSLPPFQNKVTALKNRPSEKPTLVNFKGLDDLYGFRNISVEKHKYLLAWGQMRKLLSRSDALPETAKGIYEASVAWKDFSAILHNKEASQASIVNISEDRNCPPFVSRFRKTNSSNVTFLELPCGLIEDSSVTLVAIPHGGQGSFHIDLIGSRISREADAPIVLHYNVSLPGENMTEEPFVVQNTWTDEFGWGKEERCPAHGSVNSLKGFMLDGLALCNEQLIRGTVAESSNARSSESLTNVSRSVHASANFPFAEGSLFTATLWVGLEGFHMTVNGRHETSFAFREKLEPWSVNRVEVVGDLDVLSTIAEGLPVSEDHELVVDAEHLKAPLITQKRLVMLIGVFSTGNNFERRMAIRRSWMQYEAIRSGDVAVRFFIGLHQTMQVNVELWKEAQAYEDIQFMPFVDYYSLISYKTVAICIMGTKIVPAKYIMKADDDAFVRIDEVLSILKGKPSNGLLYGLISSDSSPHREKDSKWYVSEKEWPHDKYPPWAHGPGYIISQDIAKFIVQGHQEGDLKWFKLEDVAMGIWIEHFKNSGKEVHYISDDRFYNAGCDSEYILAHYQGPRKLLCLWEKLQKEHQPNCCE